MPCTYTGSIQGDTILSLQESLEDYKQDLDELTRNLCSLCGWLDDNGIQWVDDNYPTSLWWERHKAEDVRRENLKKAKENAIASREKAEMKRLMKKYGEK